MGLSLPIMAQVTYPLNDVASPKSGYYAFIHANIVKDAKTTLRNAVLIIKQGKIEAIGQNIPLPQDAIVVDCQNKFIYPSFIDAYSDYGSAPVQAGTFNYRAPSQMISNTKGPYAWNQALKTEVSFAKQFVVQDAKAKDLRKMGFGTVLSHQMDGISRGTGAVVTLAKEKENLVLLKERASAHYSLDKGSSTQDYPNSLMGSVALLRQNFLDAAWYKSKPAKEGMNLTLQSFNEQASLPQIFEVTDKWSALRADKIGDEFGVQYIIKASGNEYQRIDDMKATKASFILPVNYPQAMDLEDPTDARFVTVAELKHWELAPTNAGAFEKAGIPFALTTNGLKDVSQFLPNLRKAIQMGLSEQKALEALTSVPAGLIGMSDQVGSLEPGKLANFLISTGPIFAEKTQIVENWIQGNAYGQASEAWNDMAGKYSLNIGKDQFNLKITGEAGAYKSTNHRKGYDCGRDKPKRILGESGLYVKSR